MNRHLVVVELDSRLFDNADRAARYVHDLIASALQKDAATRDPNIVDLRPAVSAVGIDGPFRYVQGNGPDWSRDTGEGAHLGIATNAMLIEELSHRAELGDTDHGLDYRPRITI